MVFFQSNVKFSLTYSHSLCLSIPSIDQLTLNGGPQRKSRDSKCVDTNQKWENFQELPSLPFCFVTVVFSKSNLSSIYLPYFHTLLNTSNETRSSESLPFYPVKNKLPNARWNVDFVFFPMETFTYPTYFFFVMV